mmetsp:Transcript_4205/g.10552  ORF Transcript_4205/g.10552 Transcript_4205/m.10552 type:complete len:559 (-) Transcript_4205:209-1885(-)
MARRCLLLASVLRDARTAAVGSLRNPVRSAGLMHRFALRTAATAARTRLLFARGGSVQTKALSVSITAGKPCSRPSLLFPHQCFMEPPRQRNTRSNPVGDILGAEVINGPALTELRGPRSTQRSGSRITTNDDIDAFEAKALAAGRYGGVLTLMRGGYVHYLRTWVLTHHLGVVDDHSTGRKRASQLPAMQRRLAAVIKKLSRNEPLTHPLDKAAKKWLKLVCVSPTSLVLKAPFDELATGYTYAGGDGCAGGVPMFICAPAALLYRMQQLLCCRGLLPDWLKGAAACFFADHSFNEREDVGMGQAIMLENSVVRGALAEAKDQWAKFFAEGLATSFRGVLVVGMHCPHYRGFADKYGLPDVFVFDCSSLGPDDFSRSAEATRSAAFQRIFDACRAHGVLGPGDEELLVSALGLVRDGKSDLIEALEISNVVPLDDEGFQVLGNPRAFKKLKSWPADLPAARALRDALAPNMGVAALLGACKFVPVPDSAQIKSRHRRHRHDSLVDLCTGTGGGVGRCRRRRARPEALRAGALPHRGQDGPADGEERPGARRPLLQRL